MRNREIKPGFFKNDALAQCSPYARLLFAGLWCLADREGRLEDRPVRIRAEVFPYEPVDADALLAELDAAGFIVRYEIEEAGRFLQIAKFVEHQRPHPKEVASRIPAPDRAQVRSSREKSRLDQTQVRSSRDCSEGLRAGPSGSSGPSSLQVLQGLQGEACAKPDAVASDPAPAVPPSDPSSPVVLALPCVGKGSREYAITEADVAEWTEAYPGVDVRTELKRAVQWARDNPTRRKTHTGARSFLSRWLARTQDSGRRASESGALKHRKAGWNPHHAQQMDELMAGAERVGFEEGEA